LKQKTLVKSVVVPGDSGTYSSSIEQPQDHSCFCISLCLLSLEVFTFANSSLIGRLQLPWQHLFFGVVESAAIVVLKVEGLGSWASCVCHWLWIQSFFSLSF